jgi:hypothetical protein
MSGSVARHQTWARTGLLDAARWFTMNTAAGPTARKVPLSGFHSKWLIKNQALI